MEAEICQKVMEIVQQHSGVASADLVGQVMNLFALAIIGLYLKDIRRKTNGG